MKPQGSSINKPGSKYSPGPIIYNRSLFKMGATDWATLKTIASSDILDLWNFLGKIGRIYTQLKSGFLFATPSILASCGSPGEVSIEIYTHLLFFHWHIHAFDFVYLFITLSLTCLWVYHTLVLRILVYHTEEKISCWAIRRRLARNVVSAWHRIGARGAHMCIMFFHFIKSRRY